MTIQTIHARIPAFFYRPTKAFAQAMTKNLLTIKVLASLTLCVFCGFASAAPVITGTPVVDAPKTLQWAFDYGLQQPNINDTNSNVLWDFHGTLDTCDVMLSTEGNYHMALHDIWSVFLSEFKEPLKNAFYTTSPPLVVPQLANSVVQVGNLYAKCPPSVTVANKAVIDKLVAQGSTDGEVYPIFQARGVVMLVKRGNPKNIKTIWDLGRTDVNLITPTTTYESGVFAIYTGSIYGIAQNDPHPPAGMNADKLFGDLFNNVSSNPNKWLMGARIHHRDEPWSVAFGKADVAVIYYHLGLFAKQSFPDVFDIVPLGGTIDNPQPLAGTVGSDRYAVALKGNWTPRQLEARQTLIATLRSEQFTHILEKRGLLRPNGFNGKDGANK